MKRQFRESSRGISCHPDALSPTKKMLVCYLLQDKKWLLATFFFTGTEQNVLMLHLHYPALGKAVVWGGEDKGSRHRKETKCSCGHSCSLSPAPGEAGTALVKALTTPKPAGIAEKIYGRKGPSMKNLFLVGRRPIMEHKANPAGPSLWREAEVSKYMLIPGCGCFSVTLSAPAQHRCAGIPASAGAGRRPPVCSELCAGSEKGSTSYHEPPIAPQLSGSPRALALQPRDALSSGVWSSYSTEDAFPDAKANYLRFSSMGGLSQKEGALEGKNENDTLPLPKKTTFLLNP